MKNRQGLVSRKGGLHSVSLPESAELLSLRNVSVIFRQQAGRALLRERRLLRALDSVSLAVAPGEGLALVGESGCGKTTLGRVLCRLQPVAGGQVLFRGRDIYQLRGLGLRDYRKRVQMIFQDPYSSLDPRKRVGPIIGEPLAANRVGSAADRRARIAELLEMVGLPQEIYARYPHELSGGQRQRVAIARALALSPEVIVADEPTSALDVSTQAQILSLLSELRRERGMSLVYITHNLPTAAYVADTAAVMYLGRIIEIGPVGDVLNKPMHPYTAALCSAAPTLDVLEQPSPLALAEARGELPDPASPPPGCRFHPRCWFRPEGLEGRLCVETEPELEVAAGHHAAACHFTRKIKQLQAVRPSAEALDD
jgi:oligopeptide/dipeptide ABC transporter ATP-binding protein